MEVLQRTANRGSISTGYDIDNSCKFETPERIISRPGTPDSRKIGAISYWVKRTELQASGNALVFVMNAGNTILLGFNNDRFSLGGEFGFNLKSTALYRDTSAWYHVCVAFDSTQGTASNRVKAYINGVQLTSFDTATYLSQNANVGLFGETNGDHYIGWSDAQLKGMYVAEFHALDGIVVDATDFGEFDEDSGIWKPKAYAGTYGTEGYYFNFDNASSLGADSSGNSNNAISLSGIDAANQATDTPTNNFCTWNPLWVYATQATINEGATKTVNASSDWAGAKSTIGLTKGKWYWEYKALNTSSLNGIQTDGESNIAASGNAQSKLSTMALFLGGEVEAVDAGGSRDDTGVTFTFNAAHTFGIALDMDSSTQTISFYQNGSLITDGDDINIDGLADKTVFPFNAVNNNTVTVNFGGYTANAISSAASDANGYGTFEFAPPSGYYSICTKNLAEYGG